MKIELFNKGSLYNKANLSNIVTHVVTSVKEGDLNPLDAHIAGKFLRDVGDKISRETVNAAISEAEKYKGEDYYKGSKLSVSNTGDTIDYEQDPVYSELAHKLKERKELLREAYILSQKGRPCVDETGEIITPPPIKKYGGQTLKVTF